MEELRAITSNVTGLDAIEVTASVNVLVSTTDSVSGNFSVKITILICVLSLYFDSCRFLFWMLWIAYYLLTETL